MLLRLAPPEAISAVEVDAPMAESMRALLPGVDVRLVESGAPLPFEDASFDVVLAYSVFTHLSPEAHDRAIREIARVTRSGGIFFGTTLGLEQYEGFLRASEESRAWITGVLGAPETARRTVTGGAMAYCATGRWPDYGIAILPQGWTAKAWAPFFDVASVRPDLSQAVNVAIRTEAGAPSRAATAPANPPPTPAAAHAVGRQMTADAWCASWEKHAGGAAHPALPPLPPESVQHITQSISGAATMNHAAGLYGILDQEFAPRFPKMEDRRVLDFGAGWGRITRLMLRSAPPEAISMVDVDARLVESASALLPGVHVRRIENMKPLPFPDRTFTLVFSNSVFSHLSERAHRFYVEEIARVLKPGGMFVGTTLAWRHYRTWVDAPATRNHFVNLLGAPDDVRTRLDRGEFVWGDTREWADYGIAILPDGWRARVWGDWFDLSYSRYEYTQDVPVAIRKGARG